ncbi:hypothetical protein BD414DRAFT_490072 [Trametes punicea]|nr:hypothetical protein BD414DRAFT_490072 [Trametes punicea]
MHWAAGSAVRHPQARLRPRGEGGMGCFRPPYSLGVLDLGALPFTAPHRWLKKLALSGGHAGPAASPTLSPCLLTSAGAASFAFLPVVPFVFRWVL